MGIDKAGLIDAIGVDKNTGEVVLSILDAHDWDEEREHLLLLKEKINRYLGFVESGEIQQCYPSAQDQLCRIDILFRCQPPAKVDGFLIEAQNVVLEYGCKLRWSLGL